MKNILVITSSYDLTVDYMIDKFRNKTNFYRFNTDLFCDYEINISDFKGWTIRNRYWEISEIDIHSIYYRKPSLPKLNGYEEKYHSYMYNEMLSTIKGITEVFDGICLSKPSILNKSENKIYQLRIAEKVGFRTPKSLITNSSEQAKEFCKKRKSIVKPLSIGKITHGNRTSFIQTNLVNLNTEISQLEMSPVYFQEYMPKDYELRVTVVDDKFYSVRIDTNEKVDWRKKGSVNFYSIYELPENIKQKCLEMMKICNLKFGAFDFIVNEGEYIFLEVNPNGQWYWLEEALKLDISDSIFHFLVGDKFE